MAQPKSHPKNLHDDRNCASSVSSCDYSAIDSANPRIARIDQELLANLGLANLTTAIHGSSESGKILHLFPQMSPSTIPQHIRDIETLKLSKLKQAYPKEHNSWRSRMREAKVKGIKFHPPWNDFSVFLRDNGPIPAEGHTLDKILPENGYVPENVRWASKSEQTHNRSVTVWMEFENKKKPLALWAKETNQPESTLRWRRKQGWSDAEAISGIRSQPTPQSQQNNLKKLPWPAELAVKLEELYQQRSKGSWVYDQNKILDRIVFMLICFRRELRTTDEDALEILDGQGENYLNSDPHRYTVKDEEEAKLVELGKRSQKLRLLWQFATQKFYQQTGLPIQGDERFLNHL